jgi:hypothetical protein
LHSLFFPSSPHRVSSLFHISVHFILSALKRSRASISTLVYKCLQTTAEAKT